MYFKPLRCCRKGDKMKKFIMISASMLIALTLLTSCSITIKIPGLKVKRMGIELPLSSRIIQSVSYFQEGEAYEVYELDEYVGNCIIEEIDGSNIWRPLPMNNFLEWLLYGAGDISSHSEVFKTIEGKQLFMPETSAGYYSLYDKKGKSHDPEKFAESYKDNDFGFRIAIFDMNDYKFYYLEMDR